MQFSVYLSQFNLHPQAAEDQLSIPSQLAGPSKQPPREPSLCLTPPLQGIAWQEDLGPSQWLKDDVDRKGALKLSLTPLPVRAVERFVLAFPTKLRF